MASAGKRMISVIIAGDAGSLKSALGQVDGFGKELTSKIGNTRKEVGKHLTEIGAAATGVGAALLAISAPAEQARNQLKAAIEASGNSFNTFKGQIDKTDSRMENFGHTNADTNQALTKLTQGLDSPTKAIAEMSRVANLAAAQHISLADAAALDVRMHAGATKGFKAFGIQVGKNADGTKNLGLAFQQLDQKIRGQAQASVEGFAGQLEVLKTKAIDLAAKFGEKVGPALTIIGPLVAGVGGILQSNLIPGMRGAAAASEAMAVSEDVAAESSGVLAGASTALAVALPVAAAVAAAAAIQHFHHSTLDASAGAATLQAAVHSTADQMSDAADQAAADYISKHQGVAKALKDAGLSTLQFSSALKGNKIAAREVGDALKGANLGRHSVEIGILAARTQDAEKQNERYNKALGDMKRSTDALTPSIAAEAAAAVQVANHLYDVVGATNSLHDAQRNAQTAVLDYKDAALSALGAQNDYNAAVKQYGPNSAQAQQALEALQRAQISLGSATDGMRQKALDAAAAIAGGSHSSYKYIAALRAEKAEYPQLAAWIDVYLGKLNAIPQFKNTQVSVNGVPVNVSSGVGGTSYNFGGYSHNAAGGPVSAGEWSVVGERGPELVRFGSSGRVFPNEQSRRMAGGGGGVTIQVVVGPGTPDSWQRSLSDHFVRDAQRGGPITMAIKEMANS